jgi:plasmid stabilization system protein ParE
MAGAGYRLSDRAIADLQEIADYLGERSELASDRVIAAIHSTFRTVAHDHGIGTGLEHLHPGLRMTLGTRPAQNYVVFYRVVDSRVEFTRILHSARDWIALLPQDDE